MVIADLPRTQKPAILKQVTTKNQVGEKMNKAITRWGRTRKIGKNKFIFLFGICLWGISSGLLAPLIGKLMFDWPIKIPNYIISLTVFPMCGILFGHWLWTFNEASYKDQINKDK